MAILIVRDGHFTSRDLAVPALNTTLAHIYGSVLLSDTPDKLLFDATGLILAKEMTVGGDFDCTNAKLRNTLGDRHAISLDRSRIRGSVLLRNGFSATGEVRLIGTRISNDLDCSGGAFSNNDDGDGTRVALETRNSDINHCVYLGGV